MSSSKQMTSKRTLRQVFICLSMYPPRYTLCMYSCICTYSHSEVGVGRIESERGGEGATDHKAGLKIPTWLNVRKCINFDKHMPQSPFTGQFF